MSVIEVFVFFVNFYNATASCNPTENDFVTVLIQARNTLSTSDPSDFTYCGGHVGCMWVLGVFL